MGYKIKVVGAWRSLVAHLVWDQGAAGSNPVAPTSPKTLENALKTAFSRVFLLFFSGFILAHLRSFCDKKVVKKLSDFLKHLVFNLTHFVCNRCLLTFANFSIYIHCCVNIRMSHYVLQFLNRQISFHTQRCKCVS